MTNRKTVICPHCNKAFRIHSKNSPRRETAINYILIHPNADTKEISEKLEISLRQAQYYKRSANEIRDAIAKIYSFLFQTSLRSEQ